MNHGAWQIRYTMTDHIGGKRVAFSTGTADLAIAAAIRDRLVIPLRTQGSRREALREVLAQAHQSDALSRTLIERAKEEMQITVPIGPTLKDAGKRFIENRTSLKTHWSHDLRLHTLVRSLPGGNW